MWVNSNFQTFLSLGVATLVGLSGCAEQSAEPHSVQRAALDEGSVTVSSVAEWRTLSLSSTRLVTPRWSPDGGLLMVRGFRGIGLFVLEAETGQLAHADEGYQGDSTFTDEGAICHGPRTEARLLRHEAISGRWASTETGCELMTWTEELGERVASGPWGAVYHDAYRGIVTKIAADGERTSLEDRGAWNVAVSRDGRRIAWSLGSLSNPQLLVFDESEGYRALDRGAHPTWSPDGRYLVFTIPEVLENEHGLTEYEADLWIYDVESGRVRALTETQDIAEMQPVFSPDGRQLAFSDWAGNAVYVATLSGHGEAGGPS